MNYILFLYLFVFLFGLAVGSFLNCVIYRLEKNESFFGGRSFCPYCKHILSWQDLIPILSFLILKGKCRYCGKKISWQYPLVEIATGLLFLLIFNFQLSTFNFQNFLTTSYLLLTTCFLIIIFAYDLKHYIIPDKIIFPAIGIAFLYQLFGIWNLRFVWNLNFGPWNFKPFLYAISSAILASAFFVSIFLISRGKWLGFGDVKLTFFMGLFLGFPNILIASFLAFSIGAIMGIGLILVGKKTLKSKVPFGPFLVSGTFIALFFGNQIINWYLNILK